MENKTTEKKFCVLIENNETGEVLLSADTNAVIGAVSEGDGTRAIRFTSCGAKELVNTLMGCDEAKEHILKNNAKALVGFAMDALMNGARVDKENVNEASENS